MSDSRLVKIFPREAFISAKNDDYKPILDTAKLLKLID